MADDTQEIIGTWTVKFKEWIWEYTFTPDGKVTWRDPLNNEKGSGRWAIMGKFINLSWAGSTTAESWTRPIKSTDQSGWYSASYGTGAFKANKKTPGQPSVPQGNQGRDVLPAGPDYTQQAVYVDNVVSGEYDPASGRFVVKHSDGSNIELDIQKILASAAIVPMPGASIVEMYVFYRKDGKIYPIVMDPNSTPNLVAMAREVEAALPGALGLRQIGRGILDIVDLMLMKPNMSRGVGRKSWQAKPRSLRENAIGLAGKLRRVFNKVVVNMGGTGEVENAINLNPNRVAPRKDIPNLIEAGAEKIGELFETGSVDEIVSNRLPPNTINWNQVIPGAYRVLRPQGRIIIRFQGNGENVQLIVSAMERAGFRNIKEMAGVVIEAIR